LQHLIRISNSLTIVPYFEMANRANNAPAVAAVAAVNALAIADRKEMFAERNRVVQRVGINSGERGTPDADQRPYIL
jgi:hypothetical protein